MEEIKMRPVGEVKNNFKKTPPKKKGWADIMSRIVVKSEFSQCLEGIERYSHLVILYWMHKVGEKKERNLVGSFANRTPSRPNPIGLTIVELVGREGQVLTVKGLDALDGSPVLDIKPYTGHPKDLVLEFRSPDKF